MLFSPGAWLFALCGLGLVLLLGGWRRLGAACGGIGAALIAAICVLPVDQWLLAPLENRFAPPPAGASFERIIVLGGALDAALSADRARPSLNAAAERVTTMVELARLAPQARLVFTGGPMPNRPDGPAEAIGVAELAGRLGLAPGRVVYEAASRTTFENAVLSKALVQPRPEESWLLVTSAAHMPRSIGTFRRLGWRVVAYPVGYKSFAVAEHRGTRGFGERFALIDTAAHEWVGLLYYYLRDRSSALFPAL